MKVKGTTINSQGHDYSRRLKKARSRKVEVDSYSIPRFLKNAVRYVATDLHTSKSKIVSDILFQFFKQYQDGKFIIDEETDQETYENMIEQFLVEIAQTEFETETIHQVYDEKTVK